MGAVARLTRRVAFARDARGVVYVEFLIAFPPLFCLFLGICQLSLVTMARLIVRHAAYSAARSAIVVLDEAPAGYDGAPRGSLSKGSGSTDEMVGRLFADVMDDASSVLGKVASATVGSGVESTAPQAGARMAPIRTAAYAPLLVLAPSRRLVSKNAEGSLLDSLGGGLAQLAFGLDYTRAASAVTIQAGPGSDTLVTEPVGRADAVTVRVTYLFACTVPLVRTLLCPSVLASSSSAGAATSSAALKYAESNDLAQLVDPSTRFVAITAEATLPNQGAGY